MSQRLMLTEAQQAAAVDRIGDSLALLSGAGCGKTFVLARRFTELLLAGGDDDRSLSGLVALTFTEKAAVEMSQRVRSMLAERAAAADSGPQRRRLLRWLQELPEANIATIHGFCARLLRAHAIDAGVDPNFAVCADELLVERLAAEAADQALLAAVEDQHPSAAELLARYSYNQIVEVLCRMLDERTAYRRDGTVYFAMYHPAAALHQQSLRQALLDDMAKIPLFLSEVEAAPPPPADKEESPEQLSMF